MSDDNMFYCSFVSIHYIICECGETFPTEEELKGHLEKDHAYKKERKEYKCGVCETIFKTEKACIQHYEASHLDIKEEHEPDHEIEQDHDNDHDYMEMEVPVEGTEEVEEGGEICETIFKTEQACIQHYEASHLDIKEEHGPDHEIEQDHDNDHDYLEMEVPVEGTEEVEEGGEIIYEQVIEPQVETAPPKKGRVKRERKPKSYYNAKNIVCEVCGKRYASNAALKYHQRVHTGERPYKCTECTKCFTMPLFLQIHMRTHTGERPYECHLCPKAFSNKAALLRHDRVHTGIKPYECPVCGKFFTQSNSMKLHVNTVHLKMPAPYKSKSRRNKAKQREMLREAILRVMDNEDTTAVEGISQSDNLTEAEIFVKPEVDLYDQQEVEESEVMYEDVDSREVTYEIVYEE